MPLGIALQINANCTVGSTRKIVQSKPLGIALWIHANCTICSTRKIAPSKFMKKCEKTEQILSSTSQVSLSVFLYYCFVSCFLLLNSLHSIFRNNMYSCCLLELNEYNLIFLLHLQSSSCHKNKGLERDLGAS